jgi:protein gp37
MQHTKIEWLRSEDGRPGYSWNPIKGICPVGCWYCYARSIYRRFKLDPKPWLDIAELNMTVETHRTCKRIFVCSTFELFHPVADGQMRDYIFDVIQRRLDLTFIILTKMPERIDRAMPDNVWLGTSITIPDEANDRLKALYLIKANIKFISFEPLLGSLDSTDFPHVAGEFDWVIVGRLTGHGHQTDPRFWWVKNIVNICREFRVPVFLKNNLKEIWGDDLIQEYPKVPNVHPRA